MKILFILAAIVSAIVVLILAWYAWYVFSGLTKQRRRLQRKLSQVESALEQGIGPDQEEVRRLAADPDVRKVLYRRLAEVGKESLVPQEYRTCAAFAEADLVHWLCHPNELKDPPDEVELVEIIEVDTSPPLGPIDYYVFRFRTNPPHWASDTGWMAGVSGPYVRGDTIPSTDPLGTFSELEPFDMKSPREHVAISHGKILQNGQYGVFFMEHVPANQSMQPTTKDGG